MLRECRQFQQLVLAQGIQYLEKHLPHLLKKGSSFENPVVLCSFGDYSITEGEVSEAFQFAVLKQLPIVYLVQDNEWGISATAEEARAMNAFEFAEGFKGLHRVKVDGSDFEHAYGVMKMQSIMCAEKENLYWYMQQCRCLNHHTSGVRKEFYRSRRRS